jgi:hypothetical protein
MQEAGAGGTEVMLARDGDSGTVGGFRRCPVMQNRPSPAEPQVPPIKDPQPYKDPIKPPPGDPQEDRPLHDPVPPGKDQPRI